MAERSSHWDPRVGSRVVVRHRLPGGGLTDVVGVLTAVVPAGLVVEGRRGTVTVPLADVVAGKVVPPRPSRAAAPHLAPSTADLEEVMARHWLPPDHERLGGWLLRAAGGFTHRGNSVLVAGDPGVPPDRALAVVRQWYARRGLPPLAAVPEGLPSHPGGTLADAGWRVRPGASAVVLTAATRGLVAGPAHLPDGLRLVTAPRPDPAWVAAWRYRGQPAPPHALPLLLSGQEQLFVQVLDGERVVAVARGSLAAAWAGVTAVEVEPAHRRRGLARAMLAAVAGWALVRDARSTYLQVAETNAAALALYGSAGFARHHRYDYLEGPAPSG